MPGPSRADGAREDRYQIKRQQDFRAAADAVAAALAPVPEIEKIALFGSVARPLFREVPRFQPYRRLGIEILHECKDVDLAVWLTGTGRLRWKKSASWPISRVLCRRRAPPRWPFIWDACCQARSPQPTRTAMRKRIPEHGSPRPYAVPIRFCSRRGFTKASAVTSRAVRSYRTLSPLLACRGSFSRPIPT